MHQSQLFSVIETFLPAEWKSFKIYLSTHVRSDSELMLIYTYINKYKSDLSDPNLELEKANKKLFNKKTRKSFQNLLSRLYYYVLDFITLEEFQTDAREYDHYKMMALNHRGLQLLADKQYTSNLQKIEKLPFDIWNNFYRLRAHHEILYSDNTTIAKDKQAIIFNDLIDSWKNNISDLNMYYIVSGERENAISTSDLQPLINDLKSLSTHSVSDLSKLLREAQKMNNLEDHQAAHNVYSYLKNEEYKWAHNIGSLTLVHLFFFHTKMIKKGKPMLDELYGVVKLGLRRNWLMDHNKIKPFRFLITISVACFADNENKAMDLLETYSSYINKNFQEEVYTMGLAQIKCFYGYHEESISLLNSTTFAYPRLASHGKILNLINYYMFYSDNPDFVLSQIESFAAFQRRHKSESTMAHYQGIRSFIKILKKLTLNESLDVIKNEIANSDHLVRRLWLIRHLEEKESALS